MSPDFFEEIGNLQIPDEARDRQAINSLRGYVYQIYQTLNAWITLKEDELLLIEVAEDFAVVTKNALNGIQVKDTAQSGSVTLKTESVSKTIKSLWEFQKVNPKKDVSITYLTTSKIGKEKELTFPDNHSGLSYWRVAAREGTDIEPIRNALLSLNLPDEIKDFIKVSKPDELRNKIIRRINWICGEENLDKLEQIIRDRLVYLGDQRGIPPTDSERAKDSLMAEVLRKATKENESNRVLTKADLLRNFEKATSVSLPAASVHKLLSAISASGKGFSEELTSGTTAIISVPQIPLPPRVIERADLVAHLISEMAKSGSLWLHGSSGTGKTVLAQFIARQSKYDWLLVQLRGCDASEIEFRLYRALQISQSLRMGGIILDDLPTKYAHLVHSRLSILVNEVHNMNGSIIVTSAKQPSPNLQDCFGENRPTVIKVPYLTQNEVAELVKLTGGDAQKWAGVIHSFCGYGHPQLVQARISGLRQRKWPDAEILAGIPGIGISAKEVEEECDSVRERLLLELLPNTRELLFRLSLIVGYFDRELAIAIGEVEPSIERSGEELDILFGPWIEPVANDRFRVSPLVSSAGIQTLNEPIRMEVHKRVVDHLLSRHPFPSDFLGMLLGHALGARHSKGLLWLSMAIMHVPENNRKIVSEHLFLLPLLKTQQILFKEDIFVSAMLRSAQFRVAIWAERTDLLPAIADQLLAETRMIDIKEVADGLLYLAIISLLMEQSLRISPRKWMSLIKELEQLPNGQGALLKDIRELGIAKKALDDWDILEFLFVIRAKSLKSIDELVELFTELDSLDESHRSILLSSLDKTPSGKRLMIDAAWLAEMNEGTLNGAEAAKKYFKLAEIAEKWKETDIAVECECARAVMLNEYAENSDGAIASLVNAEKKYPNNVRLIRERTKIYYGKGDHSTALTTFEKVADGIPKGDHIERAFAFRIAAISAAKMGNLPKSDEYFTKAYEAAIEAGGNMLQMAIGLKTDCALIKFQSGTAGYNEAIQLMRNAIIDAEKLKPEDDKKAKFCRLFLSAAIGWMQTHIAKNAPAKLDLRLVVGQCSNPEPPDKAMDFQCPPLLAAWYQLAGLEVMNRKDLNIMGELRSRTKTHKILSCELILNYYIMEKHIIMADINNFFSYLPEYVSKTAYWQENKLDINKENDYDFIDADLAIIKPINWISERHLDITKDAILALAAVAICSNSKGIREQLLNHVNQNKEMAVALQDFLGCFEKKMCPKGDVFEETATNIGYLMNVNVDMSPDEMFMVTYRLWEWLPYTVFKDSIDDVIANYLAQRWQMIIEHQKCLLKQIKISVPAIKTAIEESASGTKRIAKLLLAAEIAVKYKLDANQRTKLQNS